MGKRARKERKVEEEEDEIVVVIDEDNDQQQQDEETEEERVSEDYCFVCKDGGLLIVCDHKDCLKAYHPDCVGLEDSTEETEDDWICGWHRCLLCKKSSKYQCFCCPNAVCQSCFKDASFARARGNKGFCNDCLKLALLGDEGMDVDSDGEKVDFKDRETYEGLFKEYWDIIKVKEGLTLEDLHNADVQLKKGENKRSQSHKKFENVKPPPVKPDSDSDEFKKEEKNKGSSSDDNDNDGPVQPIIVKSANKRPKKSQKKHKGSKNKIEYLEWASKPLVEFLSSIEVDTSKKLSQDDATVLITKYVQENKLLHPEKKKVVLCDLRLRSLLGRKSVSLYKIYDLLEPHFPENLEHSEDDGYSSGYDEENPSLATKKHAWWRKVGSFQNKGSLLEKFQQKEAVTEEHNKKDVTVQYSQFATICPKNMKLVYLRKSLVEQLLGQYESFESKVVGGFVKVKSDPIDPKHPYKLLPVTGITNTLGDGDKRKVLLQVSNMHNDVPVCLLSNDDISEEDCEDLRQKVEAGLLEKPTVVELENKARSLHEDITKHWIARELSLLRHRIDLANEKGRRAELYEYRRRRDLLQTEEEQSRMLNEVPQVVRDVIEVKSGSEEPQATDGNGKDVGTFKSSKKVLDDQYF